MTDFPAPELSALVAARLCHDLISPMGAIGNGLELLQLSPGAGVDELALVNESLATALAKVRYYRIAFGPTDAQARQSLDEAAQLTDAMFHGRFSVLWQSGGPDITRSVARMIYLAILCLEKSLPMGGIARIGTSDGGINMTVDGRRTAPPADLWAHVIDGSPVTELKPDGVQFALLRHALVANGHRIEVGFTDGGVALRMSARDPLPA